MILDGVTSGNQTTVLYGTASVLFFGLGGMFMFGILFGDPIMEAYTRFRGHSHESNRIERRTIPYRGESHQALVFPVGSRIVPLGASVVFAGWTAAAVTFVIASSSLLVRLLLSVTAVLSGTMGLVGIAQTLRNPIPLALLRDGIVVRSVYRSSYVPWEAITEIETFVYGSQLLFGVAVADREKIKQPWLTALITKPNRSLTGYDLVFQANTKLASNDVESITQYFLDHPNERAQIEQIARVAELEIDIDQAIAF